jgi:hypothetical protein
VTYIVLCYDILIRCEIMNYTVGIGVLHIQGVPGGKVNILEGHSIGHSKQKTLYEHVSYSEPFPR